MLEPKGEFASVLAHFRETDTAKCVTFQDYRRLLARARAKDKLDAVIIATPDHRHALGLVPRLLRDSPDSRPIRREQANRLSLIYDKNPFYSLDVCRLRRPGTG